MLRRRRREIAADRNFIFIRFTRRVNGRGGRVPKSSDGAVPQHLNPDAEQEKRRQPHHDGGSGGADQVGEARRVSIEAVDQHRQQHAGRQGLDEEFQRGGLQAGGAAGAQGYRDRDRAGAGGQGHGERVEGQPAGRHIDGTRAGGFAAPLRRGVRRVQHAPARRRDDDAAGDPQHREW